jgi:hypothetical protein
LTAASMRLVHHGRVLDKLDAQLQEACTAVNGVVQVYVDVHPIDGLWTKPGVLGVGGCLDACKRVCGRFVLCGVGGVLFLGVSVRACVSVLWLDVVGSVE